MLSQGSTSPEVSQVRWITVESAESRKARWLRVWALAPDCVAWGSSSAPFWLFNLNKLCNLSFLVCKTGIKLAPVSEAYSENEIKEFMHTGHLEQYLVTEKHSINGSFYYVIAYHHDNL